jgi:hypothetical protein
MTFAFDETPYRKTAFYGLTNAPPNLKEPRAAQSNWKEYGLSIHRCARLGIRQQMRRQIINSAFVPSLIQAVLRRPAGGRHSHLSVTAGSTRTQSTQVSRNPVLACVRILQELAGSRTTHAFHSKTAFLFQILSFNEMPFVSLGDVGSSSTVKQSPESLSG